MMATAKKILVIDDESSIRQSIQGVLGDEGYQVSLAAGGLEGLEKVKQERPDVVLLDIWMEEMDGLETLRRIKEQFPAQKVIMMSGHGTIETAVKATKLGAFDFVEKPLSLERLLVLVQNAFDPSDSSKETHALRKQAQKSRPLIGDSAAMRMIRDLVRRVAPTTGSVLITGENGTGKELVAHSIYSQSSRLNKSFVEVNCAAIPEELIESELFGSEKGAYTGADQQRRGKFDQANGGTLFLDEIGDMSMKTQAKILRVLQEQKFERVGGNQTISVDVRIVAATNKDLKAEIARGAFREDLFYRLNVIPIHVPPLRERREDISPLAQHFLRELCQVHGRPIRTLKPEAIRVLESYPWPGNVRELKNLIERMVILAQESEEKAPVTAATVLSLLGDESVASQRDTFGTEGDLSKNRNLKDARQEFEREYIVRTLKDNDWNVSRTASVLGIERTHLHRKIKSFGIEADG